MKLFFVILFLLIPVLMFSQESENEIVGVDSAVYIYEPDGLVIPEVVVPEDSSFWHYRLWNNNLNGFTVFNDQYSIMIWSRNDSVDVQFELYKFKCSKCNWCSDKNYVITECGEHSGNEKVEEWYAPDYIKIPFFILAGVVIGISL